MRIKLSGDQKAATENSTDASQMIVGEKDVVFVFREDGDVDLSFPDLPESEGDKVPEHLLCALALSHALTDRGLMKNLRDHIMAQKLYLDPKRASNDH